MTRVHDHAHFWQRALLSRRNFLWTAASIGGEFGLVIDGVEGVARQSSDAGFGLGWRDSAHPHYLDASIEVGAA